MELEQQLATYRRFLNWTQEDLAKKAGISESTIYKMEKRGVMPKISTVYKLANALNIPLDEVYYPKGNRPKIRIPEELL